MVGVERAFKSTDIVADPGPLSVTEPGSRGEADGKLVTGSTGDGTKSSNGVGIDTWGFALDQVGRFTAQKAKAS